MGTFVFTRLADMLTPSDAAPTAPNRIDLRYWAEKCEAEDESDGWDSARQSGRGPRSLEQAPMTPKRGRRPARPNCGGDRIRRVWADDWGETGVWPALHNFEHDGFRFRDWERSCEVYTQRFLWCCHALEWGIDVYDAAKDAQKVGDPAAPVQAVA
jgi:hypothetical protein